MAWISFGALPCTIRNLMTARVSILLKSRASLTCFRACFLSGRAKDLSAPSYLVLKGEKRSISHYRVSAKKNCLRNTKTLFSRGGGVNYSRIFAFRWEPNPYKRRGRSVQIMFRNWHCGLPPLNTSRRSHTDPRRRLLHMNDVYHTSLAKHLVQLYCAFPHGISQPSFGVFTAVFQTFRVIWCVTLYIWVVLLDVSEDCTAGSRVEEQCLFGILH